MIPRGCEALRGGAARAAPRTMDRPAPFFVWKPSFTIGVPPVDAEHQRFFELINELFAAMHRGAVAAQQLNALEALRAYAAEHFDHEEAFLESQGFPLLAQHRKRHAWFRHQVESMALGSDAIGTLALMRDWLLHHILEADREYAAWIASREDAREPPYPGEAPAPAPRSTRA